MHQLGAEERSNSMMDKYKDSRTPKSRKAPTPGLYRVDSEMES